MSDIEENYFKSNTKQPQFKNSSNKKKKNCKFPIKLNEIKTPTSNSSARIKKNLTVRIILLTKGDRFIPVRSTEDNTNLQYMLLANKKHEDTNKIEENQSDQNSNLNNLNNNTFRSSNNINSYHNLMLDSLLLQTNESFSIDKNQIKNESRVLSFSMKNKQNANNSGVFLNQMKNLTDMNKYLDTSNTTNKPCISPTPERILDAPHLIDDYYLNLLDWSSQNMLAVSLGNVVYLWNGNTLESAPLMTANDTICSVNWMSSGNCLGVGLKDGTIELWDTNKRQQIRSMAGHSDRVSSLAWNNYLLSSGSRDAKIINHDVRIRNNALMSLVGHTQEVCSLKWSPDGSLLASGGNDNLLCIWDINYSSNSNSNSNSNFNSNNTSNTYRQGQNSGSNSFNFNNNRNTNMNMNITNTNINNGIGRSINSTGGNSNSNSIWNIIEEGNNDNSQNSNNLNLNTSNLTNIHPRYTFNNHEAAVKALAWCPFQKGLLVSGAGTKDKTIKFWNMDNGTLLNSIDAGSQVCALLWDKHEKELISSHGFSKNQICIWKYPNMCKVTELNGHMSRVLYLAMSPDGSTVVSGAGDETLRFWKIHENKKKEGDSITFDYNYRSSSSKIMNSFQIR